MLIILLTILVVVLGLLYVVDTVNEKKKWF